MSEPESAAGVKTGQLATSDLLGSVVWQEITGRRWKITADCEMTRETWPDARWHPVADFMVGGLASEERHYNGWRIRRPLPTVKGEP